MPKIRHIILFGSTGSIGTNALKVIEKNPKEFKLVGLAAGRNINLLRQQIRLHSPQAVSVRSLEDAKKLQNEFPEMIIFHGSEGLIHLLDQGNGDTLINAINGTDSLEATLLAIDKGYRICLANKETLVAAGSLINKKLLASDAEIIPIDSEQSAIFQSLGKNSRSAIRRVILTASGGPFFKLSPEDFSSISVQDALNHPTWSMGKKITIDSATMMNKALEIIETFYLFNLKSNQIEVLIHPQSIIHSMVEFIDSSIIAQLSLPDMKLPILYSLTYPGRSSFSAPSLDLSQLGTLEFFPVDRDKFKSIGMAFQVLKEGKSAGAVFNAANEVAVEHFIKESISFQSIFDVVDEVLEKENYINLESLDDVLHCIEDSKIKTEQIIKRRIKK